MPPKVAEKSLVRHIRPHGDQKEGTSLWGLCPLQYCVLRRLGNNMCIVYYVVLAITCVWCIVYCAALAITCVLCIV